MKLSSLLASAAAACAALTLAGAANAANLLTNGSFEDFGAATPDPGWMGYTFYNGGAVALPGWTVELGSADVIWTGSPWGPAYDGTNSLDINGWDAGVIAQSFNTIAGQLYTVSYAYSRNPYNEAAADAYVSVGGHTDNLHTTSNGQFGGGFNMLWNTGGFTFVGDGNQATIRLGALTPGNAGVFFDALSVTGVPEPASWALMIGGFGMAGAMLRRRRSLAAA